MPHVGALPAAQRAALDQPVCPPITLRVLMTATFRDVVSFSSGVPTFGTTYSTFQFDLSSRLVGPMVISSTRPIFPDGDYGRNELQIQLLNTDGYIAALQTGSMIALADIDQGVIEVLADISGVTQPINVFKGRIIGPPSEVRGLTTFTVVDTIWDAIRKPALYEDYSNISGNQTIEVIGGLLEVSHRTVNTLAGGHFCVYNGIVAWDAQGEPLLRYTNSDSEHRDLKAVRLENRAKPGKYSILFVDAVNFTLTYPDNSVYRGNIGSDTITPFVTILATDWTTESYATGVKIEFGVGLSYKGNPITIARNFIEKALLDNWGFAPANTMAVKMDVAAWDAAERRFQSYTIFLSETNPDNKVWERKRGKGNMPLNCLDLAQKALNHVGCFLQMRQDGLISITTPFFDGRVIYDISDENCILQDSLAINSGPQWNYLTVQYGEENGSFSAIADHDLRVLPTADVNEKIVSAPYYKAGISRFRALWLLETYVRRYHRRQQTISLKTTPQFGLPMLCGDVVRVVSSEQPDISLIAEIVEASIEVGGECSFKLSPIQQYEGAAFKLCVAHLEAEKLW